MVSEPACSCLRGARAAIWSCDTITACSRLVAPAAADIADGRSRSIAAPDSGTAFGDRAHLRRRSCNSLRFSWDIRGRYSLLAAPPESEAGTAARHRTAYGSLPECSHIGH